MTANVTIEVARRDNVLRAPAAALRVRPSDEVKKAFGAAGVSAPNTAVWQLAGGTLRPIAVTAGASDGVMTEVSGEGITEGTQVVTRIASAGTATAPRAQTASPLVPSGPRR
jgi:HlyD family secretion protein